MNRGTFMELVGFHYNNIKKLFISRMNNEDKKFDEDAFSSSFIKCNEKFGKTEITYDDAIKYFWIAFKNTSKTNDVNESKYEFHDDYEYYDFLDSFFINKENDDADLEYFYNTVMDAIAETFDENDMYVYNLHICYGWTKEEIESAGYNCRNFKDKIKAIHEFVKEYCKSKHINKHFKKQLKKLDSTL